MGDTGIFATTGEVQKYVPIWANATYNAEEYINQFMKGWESYINSVCCYNFSDAYGTLNEDVKKILGLLATAHVVMDICAMDDSGTDSRTAEFFFDRMTDVANKCEKQLKTTEVVNFIKDAT